MNLVQSGELFNGANAGRVMQPTLQPRFRFRGFDLEIFTSGSARPEAPMSVVITLSQLAAAVMSWPAPTT